jgi:rRNA maturation protein Rpf1
MNNEKEVIFKFLPEKGNSKKENEVKKNNSLTKTNIFSSKTFASKLFLKLTSSIIDPIIVCLQTLKFEPENRKKEEIEKTIPYLLTLNHFREYVQFKEENKLNIGLMTKFARVTFYQYYPKNTILKKTGSCNDNFFILLHGSISKYSLIFEKENLTLEQYLLYILKMLMINETQIIKKCHSYNLSSINLGNNELSISYFFKKNKKINFLEIKNKAKEYLTQLGFKSELFKSGVLKKVPSIENYMELFNLDYIKNVNTEGKPKISLWIGKYKLSNELLLGQFFSNISDEPIKENNIYICKTNCDIGKISRNNFVKEELNVEVKLKMQRLFRDIKKNYYFFGGINDDKFIEEYAPLFLYKKFKKGEKMFLQGGIYEGIFLIVEGTIQIYTKTAIDKLIQLLFKVIHSTKNFQEHIPLYNPKKIIEEIHQKQQLLYSKDDIPHFEFTEMKTVDIGICSNFDIIGLNEFYDHKTELFNFTAECMSEEATLLFMTKNDFQMMMCREISVYNSIISIIDLKIQYISGKIKSFIEQCIYNFDYKYKKKNILSKTIKNYKSKIPRLLTIDNNSSDRGLCNIKQAIKENHCHSKIENIFNSISSFKVSLNKEIEKLNVMNNNNNLDFIKFKYRNLTTNYNFSRDIGGKPLQRYIGFANNNKNSHNMKRQNMLDFFNDRNRSYNKTIDKKNYNLSHKKRIFFLPSFEKKNYFKEYIKNDNM